MIYPHANYLYMYFGDTNSQQYYKGHRGSTYSFGSLPFVFNINLANGAANTAITFGSCTIDENRQQYYMPYPGFEYTYTVDGVDSYYIGESGSYYHWRKISDNSKFKNPVSSPGVVVHLAATRITVV